VRDTAAIPSATATTQAAIARTARARLMRGC
jgi:hypothetical protein